jgi:hypothetical protein
MPIKAKSTKIELLRYPFLKKKWNGKVFTSNKNSQDAV